jgi:hypothetical protein
MKATMKRLIGIAPRAARATALTMAVVIAAAAPAAVAQQAGDDPDALRREPMMMSAYGGGALMAEPTGPYVEPDGTRIYSGSSPSGYYGYSYPYSTYSSGYSSAPTTNTTQTTSAPYQTDRYYEPGDGYRYPLYYNPATGGYVYYPVRR